MAKRRKGNVQVTIKSDDDETAITVDSVRDYAMARLGGSLASIDAARAAVTDALAAFVCPDDDPKGKDRRENVAAALEALGLATRGVESVEEVVGQIPYEEAEPFDGEEEDPDEDDEDEDEDDQEEDDEDE